MKKIALLLMITALFACSDKTTYSYSLTYRSYIPESCAKEYREWITETVRAASQHVTGGDYEDVAYTIRQAKWSADDIFGVKEKVLKIKEHTYSMHGGRVLYHYIRYKDMTINQRDIFNKLNSGLD